MKRTLLFFSLLATAATYAQDCTKIFISEYLEGLGNNKALEIYNPTSQPVNLADYFIARYSNGSANASVKNSVQLTGTIAPYDVYVAVLDKRNPAGTGQEAPIWDSLKVKADGFYSPNYDFSDAFYWNGNDAVLLAKGNLAGLPLNAQIGSSVPGFAIIDVFGKIGENPANSNGVSSANDGAWSTVAPYNTGQGVLITQDHSLIRKPGIKKGVITNPAVFNGLAEWDSIPPLVTQLDANGNVILNANGEPKKFGNFFSLGTHNCNCTPEGLSVKENKEADFMVYPNPTTDGVVYIKNAVEIREVQVVNALGQQVGKIRNHAASVMTVNVGTEKGVYILRIIQNDGTVGSKRIVIK